jgi:hypothetical protein
MTSEFKFAVALEKRLAAIESRLSRIEAGAVSNPGPHEHSGVKATGFDFSLNPRAFMKRFGYGRSGPAKFTLLLAYFARGEIGQDIQLGQLDKCWSSMTAFLGKFNRFYSNEAKTRGWVNSTQKGHYSLAREWKGAFRDKST